MSDQVWLLYSRAIQGAAVGLVEPMVVAAMGSLYKDSLGMVTAIYELSFSASLALGPLMGGFLYDVGGFYLPFVVTGESIFITFYNLSFNFGFNSSYLDANWVPIYYRLKKEMRYKTD